MTGHISEELPLLLTGEASRDVVMDAATHLRGCEDCQQELVSAVVAHASLTSAHRFAPEIVASSFELPLHDGAQRDEGSLPDLSSIFAQAREEASSPATDGGESGTEAAGAPAHGGRVRTLRRFSPRTALTVAAAAAGIVIGAGAVAVVGNLGDSSPGTAAVVALSAFDKGTTTAKATVTEKGRMRLDASSLPELDANHRYEVWLTNDNRTQMQPIGWIGTDGTAELTVPNDLMAEYSDIEVSVQRVDAPTYTYSGTSVLRGGYDA